MTLVWPIIWEEKISLPSLRIDPKKKKKCMSTNTLCLGLYLMPKGDQGTFILFKQDRRWATGKVWLRILLIYFVSMVFNVMYFCRGKRNVVHF